MIIALWIVGCYVVYALLGFFVMAFIDECYDDLFFLFLDEKGYIFISLTIWPIVVVSVLGRFLGKKMKKRKAE